MSEAEASATEQVFAERRARADMESFYRILNRTGGEPPRKGDELPDQEASRGSPSATSS